MSKETLEQLLQIPKLAGLCLKYSVIRLSVFGSVLREDFSSSSDLDFVVEFSHSETFTPSEQFFDFLEDLENLYGRKVDLVERTAIKNPFFMRSIEMQEVQIFAA